MITVANRLSKLVFSAAVNSNVLSPVPDKAETRNQLWLLTAVQSVLQITGTIALLPFVALTVKWLAEIDKICVGR